MPHWVVVGVESSVAWPLQQTSVTFRGHELLLRPGADDKLPSIAFQYPPTMTFDEALLVVRHYLSSLSWVEQAGIRELSAIGGSGPFWLGRSLHGRVVTEHFRHDYLPDPPDDKARLALAFYREAMSAEPVTYKCLNFFKVINILHRTGPQQAAWINANVANLRNVRATERLTALREQALDVGEYLYASGRCAVAHSFNEPLVNPEAVEDVRRLAADLPVMQELAELAIEREFGVKSRRAVWNEHLYHLEGFRAILGEALIERLKTRACLAPSDIPALPALSLGVRDKPAFATFTSLHTEVTAVEAGTIWVRCTAGNGAAQLLIGLAVADELLHFDPEGGVAIAAEASKAALQARRDHLMLLRYLLGNGQLEIQLAATGERLGRTDAYIGTNIDLTATLKQIDTQVSALDAALTTWSEHDGD